MPSTLSHSAAVFFLVPLVFCFFIIPVFIRLSVKRKLLEKRGGRKIHIQEIPSMGGVPMFISFLIGVAILLSFDQLREIRFFFGASFLIFILGLRDDLIPMKPSFKLISQIFPALIIIYDPVFNINAISESYGLTYPWIYFLYLILIFVILFITNIINLIDGIDGLAGSVSMVSLMFFSTSFLLQGEYLFMGLALMFAGSTVAFLYYNWSPAKIFMGDTGALFLGFILSVFAIKLLTDNTLYKHPEVLSFAALAVPIYDTLRTFINRISREKSPFFADKTHIHHLLLRLGMSHKKATLILVTLQLIIIIIAVVMENYHVIIAFLSVVLIIAIFNLWLENELRNRIKQKNINKLRR